MLPHVTPLPRTAASMLMPHPVPSRATRAAVAAGVLLFPTARTDARDAPRARLRSAITEILDQPRAVARLTAAARICGADWRDADRVALLRALQQVPAARCDVLPKIQGLMAGSLWSSPADTLRWALEAEAHGQLPVWAAHGILPRLERCKDPRRTVAQLRSVQGSEMALFLQRVETLCRGSRQAAALSMEEAVDACVRLPAAQVGGLLQAVAASGRPSLAPLALGLGLLPSAIKPLSVALDSLPAAHTHDAGVVLALARVVQQEPRGLPRRLGLAAALRLDATGLVALCSVPAARWEVFAYEAQFERRLGAIASCTQRVLEVQALARQQQPLWQPLADAGAAALRWLRGRQSVSK